MHLYFFLAAVDSVLGQPRTSHIRTSHIKVNSKIEVLFKSNILISVFDKFILVRCQLFILIYADTSVGLVK